MESQDEALECSGYCSYSVLDDVCSGASCRRHAGCWAVGYIAVAGQEMLLLLLAVVVDDTRVNALSHAFLDDQGSPSRTAHPPIMTVSTIIVAIQDTRPLIVFWSLTRCSR